MSALVLRCDALSQPLADESVDLIITSPPYFSLRSYQDGGEHYDGQIGSEETPEAFLAALWAVMTECWRVLKPSGSCWVNLGDKYAGSGGHNNSGLGTAERHAKADVMGLAQRRNAPNSYNKASGGARAKSLMGLPWRFAIGCIDGQADPEAVGWILRAEVVWNKPNGLPESVRDRVRRSHEQWFHFVKSPQYFAGIDEIREVQIAVAQGGPSKARQNNWGGFTTDAGRFHNPLGKLPGSVWRIPSEPLKLPPDLGVEHFAAFPTEWPRRIILGWSPAGICTECGEGRVPVVEKALAVSERGVVGSRGTRFSGTETQHQHNRMGRDTVYGSTQATVTGYACACTEPTAPTRPAVVVDPFGGTGTVAMVANALGRTGVSLDLSADYCRVAEWRANDELSLAKVRAKTYGKPAPKRRKVSRDQATLFG